ncbi:MAG TPA: VOC family protein [Chloroflexota bacterium]|nr:VOC family protein [Chloroflexota bacterium]
MLTAIHHTSLTVSDLERSVQFYTDLGMQVLLRQTPGGTYLQKITGFPDAHIKQAHLAVNGTGHRLELFEYVSPAGQPVRSRNCDPGNTHLAFLVDDLDAMYAQLKERGVECVSPPVTIDAGANVGGKGLYLRDPDGFTIELFQPAT